MGLLKDMVSLQPGVNSLATQIGLYKKKQEENRIAEQTQSILDDTIKSITKNTGGADPAISFASNPLAFQQTIAQAVLGLQGIGNSEGAQNVNSWFQNLISSKNADTSARQVDVSAQNAQTQAEQLAEEKRITKANEEYGQRKMFDILGLDKTKPFEVEYEMGGKKQKLDISQMTYKDANAATGILKEYFRNSEAEKVVNKQLEADKSRATDALRTSLIGNFNTVWREENADNYLDDKAYQTLERNIMSAVNSSKTGVVLSDVVNKTLKDIGKTGDSKALLRLQNVAGQVFSASRDVFARIGSQEQTTATKTESAKRAQQVKAWGDAFNGTMDNAMRQFKEQWTKTHNGVPPTAEDWADYALKKEASANTTGKKTTEQLLDELEGI